MLRDATPMTRLVPLLVCLLAAGCKSQEAPDKPAGSGAARADQQPAEHQFDAWLTAFNAADRAKLVAWHGAFSPYSEKTAPDVDDELGFRQQTGGFEIKK